jgi:cell division transport system ATP-binding protein
VSATIRFAGVTKRYPGGHDALVDASFELGEGEFVYLTGPSGAGKSTVLKLVAGIERPTQGTVFVNQQNVGRLTARSLPWLRRNLGLVMPELGLLDDRTVGDNVRLPLDIAGVDRADAGRRVRAALEKVGLAGRERHKPLALSGGEQQRVAIARAVVNRPSVLLADEPTANLDRVAADAVLGLFRDFHAVGVTVVIATHDAGAMARHDARRIALDRGRVLDAGARGTA